MGRGAPFAPALLIALVFTGCVSSADESPDGDSAVTVHEGSWYVRTAWPHDGNPVESANFIVYSDAASLDARREVATVAEEVWAELIEELSIRPDMLGYPEGRDKIDIYAYHDYDPRDWGGWAYHGGLLVWSPDHDRRQTGNNQLAPVLKHELVHVIQWLITDGESRPIDTWFIEGLPLALAGDTTAIRGLDQLDRLTAEYGATSPISIESYSQITGPDAGEHFFYPLFHLAFEYLMDDRGGGSSPVDMRDVLIDVADGVSFDAAFEDRLGLRVDDFENEFFSLMSAYLPTYRNRWFAPVPFAMVSALVVALVMGALVVGRRHWQVAGITGSIDTPQPGRTARIGFWTQITASSLVVVVFFLGMLYTLGTDGVLLNAAFGRLRLLAYAILAAYLPATILILRWAVRQWTRNARTALLVAPFVLVATGATFLVFIVGSALI